MQSRTYHYKIFHRQAVQNLFSENAFCFQRKEIFLAIYWLVGVKKNCEAGYSQFLMDCKNTSYT